MHGRGDCRWPGLRGGRQHGPYGTRAGERASSVRGSWIRRTLAAPRPSTWPCWTTRLTARRAACRRKLIASPRPGRALDGHGHRSGLLRPLRQLPDRCGPHRRPGRRSDHGGAAGGDRCGVDDADPHRRDLRPLARAPDRRRRPRLGGVARLAGARAAVEPHIRVFNKSAGQSGTSPRGDFR